MTANQDHNDATAPDAGLLQRLRLLVVPLIAAVLLYFGLDNFSRVSDRLDSPVPAPANEISGYSEGINTISFDERGRIRYTLSATRQISYQNALTEFDEPFMQLYREDESGWNIIAESGRISSSRDSLNEVEEILLSGGVEVYQLDEFGNRTVIATEALTVDPATETLRTELLVTLHSDTLEQSAIGMHANLATEEYQFFRDIRGRYAAAEN